MFGGGGPADRSGDNAVALLFLPAIAIGIAHPIPAPDTPAKDLVAFFAAHRTSLLVAFSLSGLGWGGLLIVFGGGLWAILRRAEGGSGLWSAIVFAACVATAAAGIVILQTGVISRWVAHGGFAVAAIHLSSSVSLAREGAFSPGGVLPNLAPLSHFAWLIGVAVALLCAPPAKST